MTRHVILGAGPVARAIVGALSSRGIAVFVPSGRDTYVRLPANMPAAISMICTIGDHQLRGMWLNVEVR